VFGAFGTIADENRNPGGADGATNLTTAWSLPFVVVGWVLTVFVFVTVKTLPHLAEESLDIGRKL
jgi:hypothetical protein